jgi:hypothetical protein
MTYNELFKILNPVKLQILKVASKRFRTVSKLLPDHTVQDRIFGTEKSRKSNLVPVISHPRNSEMWSNNDKSYLSVADISKTVFLTWGREHCAQLRLPSFFRRIPSLTHGNLIEFRFAYSLFFCLGNVMGLHCIFSVFIPFFWAVSHFHLLSHSVLCCTATSYNLEIFLVPLVFILFEEVQ